MKCTIILIVAVALLCVKPLIAEENKEIKGYNGLYMGHSFFWPSEEKLENIIPDSTVVGHKQYLVRSGGAGGSPGNLWANKKRRDAGQRHLDTKKIDLLVMTYHSPYSSDWGSSFAEGFASAGMEFLATSDGSFWGTQSYNTNNDTLLESADGTFFSIGSSLPEDVYHVKGLLGMGSRLVLISSGYGPDNKLRFAIYSKLRNQDFVFHGYFNETPSFSPWAMKSDSTERGAIIALPQRGVIEIIVSSTDVNITAREDAQFNLDWRGAAIGIQDCVMVTESGVVATAQLDLRSSNPDLDEDGVEDQYETGTGVYVSPTDTGTSPVDMDSDDDGFSDGYELANDTNPNLSNDTPPTDQAWVRLAVEFSFAAPLGQTFRVEGSDNMTDWTAIETGVQGNGGMGTRLYSTKGQQKQFYRAVTE